jgi:hypothetical protein
MGMFQLDRANIEFPEELGKAKIVNLMISF